MRALVSVSDKKGLVPFVKGLVDLGWEIIATGGTQKLLESEGVKTIGISEVTGFPEICDGRVKTLHPKVHGGILARRDVPAHMETLKENGIETIELVCVNLYPFKQTIAKEGVTLEENGVVRFPDAPTQRGVKHLHGLIDCVREGLEAWVVFIVQMRDVRYFEPNRATHPEFARALCEAREAGNYLSSVLRTHRHDSGSFAYIAGGETVVRVTGNGKGGRNQEIALSAAAGIAGLTRAAVFSVGSDGTDGPTDAAGGYVDGDTFETLKTQGVSVCDILRNNDSYNALLKAGGLIFTGPTGTNVNDLSVALLRAD